ncbi:MAG: glycerol-3-phosphate 1-O-acyltransferase PlsY [Planctomycetota bacterium]|jgi:glycerol-3-phosphate acyltransferase PlsY
MTYTSYSILVVFGYLLGSIPFGLIIAKAHGVDLRSIGSGNIGATNVSRALGKKWGIFCFILDVLKGLLPTLAAMPSPGSMLALNQTQKTIAQFLWLAVGCAAILGHIFPIYLNFKGGKGVATSFGVALGIWPYFTLCAAVAIVTWAVFVLIWKYVSLASIAASVVFPIVLVVTICINNEWEFLNLWPLVIVSALIPLMVILRHRENIKRLLTGTESKIFKK